MTTMMRTMFAFLCFVVMSLSAQGAEAIKLDYTPRGPLASLRSTEGAKACFGNVNVANLLASVYDRRGNHLTPLTVAALKYPLYINCDAKPNVSAAKDILSADSQLSASERKALNASTKNPVTGETVVVNFTASNSHPAPKATTVQTTTVSLHNPKPSPKAPVPNSPIPVVVKKVEKPVVLLDEKPQDLTLAVGEVVNLITVAAPEQAMIDYITSADYLEYSTESKGGNNTLQVRLRKSGKVQLGIKIGSKRFAYNLLPQEAPPTDWSSLGPKLLYGLAALGALLSAFFYYAYSRAAAQLVPQWLTLPRIKIKWPIFARTKPPKTVPVLAAPEQPMPDPGLENLHLATTNNNSGPPSQLVNAQAVR